MEDEKQFWTGNIKQSINKAYHSFEITFSKAECCGDYNGERQLTGVTGVAVHCYDSETEHEIMPCR